MSKNSEGITTNNTKMLGGNIPEDLFWQFKKAHAERKETSTQAIQIAIQLYIDAVERGEKNE